MRPETPTEIRARLSALDRMFEEAGAPREGTVSPEDLARVMARIRAAYLDPVKDA